MRIQVSDAGAMAAVAWAIQRSTPLILRPIPYGWAVFTKTEVDAIFPQELEEQFPLPMPEETCDNCGEDLEGCDERSPVCCRESAVRRGMTQG